MTCAFNKCAKINTCIGTILLIVAGIVFLSAHLSAEAGFDVETMGGGRSNRITVETNDLHGVYIRQSDTCESGNLFGDEPSNPTVTVQHVATSTEDDPYVSCGSVCTDSESCWEAEHDPPLRSVGSFSPIDDPNDCSMDYCDSDYCSESNPPCRKLHGAYTVTCSTDCWMVDLGEELAEAVGGIMGAIVMLVVVIILAIVGSILCCVACCCCCQGPDKGAPPPVQGQVVGQPVGSA